MLIIVAGTRTDGSCPSWVNRYRNATCALRRFPLDSDHIADAPTCRTKYGSPRLFQEHGKWCNPQSASCQRDVPKSCKLRAAPVPSAGKHCAIHSILVLRPLDRCVCPHCNAFGRTTAQQSKSGAKAIDADVPDQRSKLADHRSQSREETYDEHAIGTNLVCRWPAHRGAPQA